MPFGFEDRIDGEIGGLHGRPRESSCSLLGTVSSVTIWSPLGMRGMYPFLKSTGGHSGFGIIL